MGHAAHLRSRLLPAYYYGTLPLRKVGGWFASRQGWYPLAVVYYHRVADRAANPWTISNREFSRQLDWLHRNFELISLAAAQQRIAAGSNTRPAVCITFDDGYAENCEHALPQLIARGIPVTYFVASRFILNQSPFPHDAERGEPLPPNTVAQLRSLAAQGIEIGAHTRSHADLGPISDTAVLWKEIAGSREDLEQAVGHPVRFFAFPYGQYSNLHVKAFRIARQAGFSGVCSAYGGYNFPGADPFHLQRIHGDPCFLRLRSWLNLDPRIAASVERFDDSEGAPARAAATTG